MTSEQELDNELEMLDVATREALRRLSIYRQALEEISRRDPGVDSLCTANPENCTLNCIGCVARVALKRASR